MDVEDMDVGAAKRRRHGQRRVVLPKTSGVERPPRQDYRRKPPPPPGGRGARSCASLMRRARPFISYPFSAAIAAWASEAGISTKPKPRGRPVSRSLMSFTESTLRSARRARAGRPRSPRRVDCLRKSSSFDRLSIFDRVTDGPMLLPDSAARQRGRGVYFLTGVVGATFFLK